MNIQAINANPTLGRRQVPRNNSVSFGKKLNVKNEHIKNAGDAVSDAAKLVARKAKRGFEVVSQAVSNGVKSGKKSAAEFASKHKGAKGVKIAATAITAVVAGGFAIKEVYDIATKSNPER